MLILINKLFLQFKRLKKVKDGIWDTWYKCLNSILINEEAIKELVK